MRSQRKGLTPRKAVAVYCLAFLLVGWHESGRLAGWFENLAAGSNNAAWSDAWFRTAETLKSLSEISGARRLAAWETNLVDRLNHWPEVGQRQAAGGPSEPINKLSKTPEKDGPGPPDHQVSELPLALAAASAGAPAVGAWPPALAELAHWAHRLISEPTAENLPRPATVLLTGDSMMLEGLGPPLQKSLLETEGLKVIREGRYGTGLARLDAFDWLGYFSELLKTHKPDLVIITLGANDCQDIVIDRKRHFPASDSWNSLYAERVGKILTEAGKNKALVIWVGLPIMGKELFNTRIDNLNKVVEKECAQHGNCRFWSTWKMMTNSQGLYDDFLPDETQKKVRVRGKDKIHLTEAGGRMMTAKLLKALEVWVDFAPASDRSQLETDKAGPETPPQIQSKMRP